MADIEIIGVKLLTEKQKEIADIILNEYHKKIQRLIKNPLLLKVHIKEYDKDGKKSKYSINTEAIFAGKMIESSSWDYDFARAIHKAMKKIESEMEKKFKVSKQQ
jgi:ribosome-associated translation inhibitor RaiA